ncbi:MAG: hypothetical protein AAGD38_15165 [Acidobacteriota bacterium]
MLTRFCLIVLWLAFPLTSLAEPVRVLMLDYNARSEHDVLLSHLCVERCTTANGCPASYQRDGVDYFSDDFVVFRPHYLGSAVFVTEVYKNQPIDFLSISGHHASGFSGDYGRGRFDTERLQAQLGHSEGIDEFFTHPSTVMLHGCRTDVKATFDGDPVEYVIHVIEDTQVRDDDFERLLAAVQQMGGIQEAYRDLFPNACILGYAGTQTPGGLLEIYGQVNAWLRHLANDSGRSISPRFDLAAARRSWSTLETTNRAIGKDCPNGWPCNLCRTAPDHYRPLATELARYLRQESHRVHRSRRAFTPPQANARERALESASFYHNTRWSCPTVAPGTSPVLPEPIDESPFARLFLQLVLLELDSRFEPDQARTLRHELMHRLGQMHFGELDAMETRAWLRGEPQWGRLRSFMDEQLVNLSTYRQRDLFIFLGRIGCAACLRPMFSTSTPDLLRENAALALRPELGTELYRLALADTEPRVRRAAASRLGSYVDLELIALMNADTDAEVQALASRPFHATLDTLRNGFF